MKRILSACIAVLFVLLTLSSCDGAKKYTEYSFDYFDTVTTVSGYASTRAEFDEAVSLVMSELDVYHKLYDIYNEYDGINNLYTVNRVTDGAHERVKVDRRIIDLLEFSLEMHRLTDGRCNVAMGSVLSIWHAYREAGEAVPPTQLLSGAAEHCDVNDLIIYRDSDEVYISDPDMTLDVGAVAKGYATEQIAKLLEEKGYTGYVLNVGGNVRCVGAQNDGSPWTVGVESADEGAPYVAMLSLESESLVTSGNYQRFYTVDGVRYHHIIDPDTLFPSDRYVSVSVLSADSGICDALSTALFSMDTEAGMALLEGLDGACAIWVKADGSVTYSTGIEKYLK